MKLNIISISMLAASLLGVIDATAAAPSVAKVPIRVSPDLTSLIVMPENIKLVDISTPYVVGNQCGDNILRIKPSAYCDSVRRSFREGEQMASITIVGERHIAQYDIEFCSSSARATNILNIPYNDMSPYINPDVAMPVSEMARLSWAVYASKRKFHDITRKANGIRATVNNIYSVGNYFFIDYSLRNETNIPYKIEEVRVKLTDKKDARATNSQTIQLTPAFSLMSGQTFKKNYRNVIVIDKLTFPDEKVLVIEVSENQISGRVIDLAIDYKDVLNADTFSQDVMDKIPEYRTISYYSNY